MQEQRGPGASEGAPGGPQLETQMSFRKPAHRDQMPNAVREILRPGSRPMWNPGYVSFAKADPGAGPDFTGWYLFRSVTVAQILQILRTKWPSASEAEARATAEVLGSEFLKPRGPDTFLIVPPPVAPEKFNHGGGSWKDYRRSRNRGVCPTCGMTVDNPNRHNNSGHRAEECRLAQVREVLGN